MTKNDNRIEKLVENYKIHLKTYRLKDELFKWQLLTKSKGKPRLDVPDFEKEMKSIYFANLIYHAGISVIYHLAKEKSEAYKSLFESLFDENTPLTIRVKAFERDVQIIYKELKTDFQPHHDERTIATFLTIHNPEKYTFYKNSFYKKYCQLLGITPKSKGEKYEHYLELVDDLIENYIKKDAELITIFREIISSEKCYEDPNFKILAQDILYQMLENQVRGEKNYWRIGTSDDDLGVSYWDFMRDNMKICIGWSGIGDLKKANVFNKQTIQNLMSEVGYKNEAKSVQSRKAGEIYDFYANAKIGDIILAQKGETVLGVGIIKDDYQFEESDEFAHQREVEWHMAVPNFTNKIGLRTTFYKIQNSETDLIFQIENLLNPSEMQNDFIDLLRKIGRENAHVYFVYAAQLVDSLNIVFGDERITYSTRNFKRLSIIIGQRYCFNYATDKSHSWGSIQIDKIKPTEGILQEVFAGSPQAYYIDCVDFKEVKTRFIESMQAAKFELNRTFKSSYRTNSSLIFEKAIFDEAFREQVFAVAFDNADIDLEIPMQMNPATKFSLNQILYGPPGTGKTYRTINKALEIVGERIEGRTRKELKYKFNKKVKEGQIVFTTFHQSMSYEDFIEGLKPETDASGNISYPVQSGIFKTICQAAKTPNQTGFDSAYDKLKTELIDNEQIMLKTPKGKEFAISLNSNDNLTLHTGQSKEKQGTLTKENIQKQINGEDKFKGWEGYFNGVIEYLKAKFGYSTLPNSQNKNYVIIIDEINRGNVSQIFGELITLIEHDKRLGRDEAIEVKLPYSKEMFGVPSNVYIIGTMNTADRSVEALDTALRRRFSFEEMPPCYDLEELEYEIVSGITANQLLRTINNRIEKLLDKDHLIGHSFLIKKVDEDALTKVVETFYKNIIPLLQEYFFGDYGKIGLILGNGFVKKKDDNYITFAQFDYDIETREMFEIIDHRRESNSTQNFESAIKKLMNV